MAKSKAPERIWAEEVLLSSGERMFDAWDVPEYGTHGMHEYIRADIVRELVECAEEIHAMLPDVVLETPRFDAAIAEIRAALA